MHIRAHSTALQWVGGTRVFVDNGTSQLISLCIDTIGEKRKEKQKISNDSSKWRDESVGRGYKVALCLWGWSNGVVGAESASRLIKWVETQMLLEVKLGSQNYLSIFS